MEKKQRPTFPKSFFTQPRPHVTKKEALEDSIPFKWSSNVLEGKSKVKIVAMDKKIS